MPQLSLNTFLSGLAPKDSTSLEQQGVPKSHTSDILDFQDKPMGAEQSRPFSLDLVSGAGGASQSSSHPTVVPTLPIPNEALLPPVLQPLVQGKRSVLQTKQLWEGTVVDVRKNEFLAIVNDRTEPSNPEEEVSFDLADISEQDLKLVEVGASFYWVIGRERTPAGTIRNISSVQFRRIPSWSSGAISEIATRAGRFTRLFREQE